MLPKYRGAAPIQWSLMNGDNITGVSIFQIEKVDTGKIIYQEKLVLIVMIILKVYRINYQT